MSECCWHWILGGRFHCFRYKRKGDIRKCTNPFIMDRLQFENRTRTSSHNLLSTTQISAHWIRSMYWSPHSRCHCTSTRHDYVHVYVLVHLPLYSLHTQLQSTSTQKCLYSMFLQLLPHCSLPVEMKTFHGGRTSVLISKVLNFKCSCLRAHLCVCVDIRWNFVNIVLSRVKWWRTTVRIRIFSRWMCLDVWTTSNLLRLEIYVRSKCLWHRRFLHFMNSVNVCRCRGVDE